MLTVTPNAREYFQGLLEQQPAGTNLRLQVLHAGTPKAEVDLTFCPEGEQASSDTSMECGLFVLFVESQSLKVLNGAVIDFERHSTGGDLSIRAPGLKGERPKADAPIEERIAWVLEARINPMVASHGGVVSLVEVTSDKDVVLQFGGGCQGCGMIGVTLKQGVETTLKQEVPEIRQIIDATDHASGTDPYYQ